MSENVPRSSEKSGNAILHEGSEALSGVPRGRSRFCDDAGVDSEYAYKKLRVDSGSVMYHAHIGLNTWASTNSALKYVTSGLDERGFRLDRFGLCLERGMSVPSARRDELPRETGPRLEDHDWSVIANFAQSQPHLGDFMIGTEASFENTLQALRVGISTIGNLGQYFTFHMPGRKADSNITLSTARALGAMAAARGNGAIVHSYLDDGPAMQLSNYGNYLAWAALEVHIIEEMIGARLGHCFGGLVPQPIARSFLAIALKHLHRGSLTGTMIYGNTVDYTRDKVHNSAVLSNYLLIDIATQLRHPTGHAVNPVPLTENIRIPSAEEILEVQLMAREIEREARRSIDLFDWPNIEAQAAEAAAYAQVASQRMLKCLEDDGIAMNDPMDILKALRDIDVVKLENRLDMRPPPGIARLEPWKASAKRTALRGLTSSATSLAGFRVVIASFDVHDLVRDTLMSALPARGAEVIVLPSDSEAQAVAAAAIAEDAQVIVASTYNGAALTLGTRLHDELRARGYRGLIIMGGVLNEVQGHEMPVDVRDNLQQLGIVCPRTLSEVPELIASLSTDLS